MRKIGYLIVHNTASHQHFSAQAIQNYFLRSREKGGRGWKKGGYHLIIEALGTVVRFYQDSETTNGVIASKGISNSNSVHIAWIGGFEGRDNRTEAQIESLKKVLRSYILEYPNIQILGHREVNNTFCPSFDVQQFLKEVLKPEDDQPNHTHN